MWRHQLLLAVSRAASIARLESTALIASNKEAAFCDSTSDDLAHPTFLVMPTIRCFQRRSLSYLVN
jgi:hypothetical protein